MSSRKKKIKGFLWSSFCPLIKTQRNAGLQTIQQKLQSKITIIPKNMTELQFEMQRYVIASKITNLNC